MLLPRAGCSIQEFVRLLLNSYFLSVLPPFSRAFPETFVCSNLENI